MKFLVESEFQGQESQKPAKTAEPPVLSAIPRVGFGTDRPYIALFWAGPSGPARRAGYEPPKITK